MLLSVNFSNYPAVTEQDFQGLYGSMDGCWIKEVSSLAYAVARLNLQWCSKQRKLGTTVTCVCLCVHICVGLEHTAQGPGLDPQPPQFHHHNQSCDRPATNQDFIVQMATKKGAKDQQTKTSSAMCLGWLDITGSPIKQWHVPATGKQFVKVWKTVQPTTHWPHLLKNGRILSDSTGQTPKQFWTSYCHWGSYCLVGIVLRVLQADRAIVPDYRNRSWTGRKRASVTRWMLTQGVTPVAFWGHSPWILPRKKASWCILV